MIYEWKEKPVAQGKRKPINLKMISQSVVKSWLESLIRAWEIGRIYAKEKCMHVNIKNLRRILSPSRVDWPVLENEIDIIWRACCRCCLRPIVPGDVCSCSLVPVILSYPSSSSDSSYSSVLLSSSAIVVLWRALFNYFTCKCDSSSSRGQRKRGDERDGEGKVWSRYKGENRSSPIL